MLDREQLTSPINITWRDLYWPPVSLPEKDQVTPSEYYYQLWEGQQNASAIFRHRKYSEMMGIIGRTLPYCNSQLNYERVTVELIHQDQPNKGFEHPIVGYASQEGVGFIFFNQHPGFPDATCYLKEAERFLPMVVAHEFGHMVRIRAGQRIYSIWDLLIHEGFAMFFAGTKFPSGVSYDHNWPVEVWRQVIKEALTTPELLLNYSTLSDSDLLTAEVLESRWTRGGHGFPKRAAYLLGELWVRQFVELEHPTLVELAGIPTKEIIGAVTSRVFDTA